MGDDSSSLASVAVFERRTSQANNGPTIVEFRQRFRELSGRFEKVAVTGVGSCPEWHIADGEPAWVMLDEIVVE